MELPELLKDETTRTVLTWLGTGVAAVIGAGWTVYKYRRSKASNSKPPVSASNGSISAGRDIRDNKIEIHSDRKR